MSEDNAHREALWKLYQEHCTHMRHHEVQRSTVASSMIAIAGALLGVATFDKALTIADAPLLAMVSALGTFGAFFSMKQYERANLHMEHARAARSAIDETLPGRPIAALKNQADARHASKFPRLQPLRIYNFWLILYLFVALVGTSLTCIAVLWPTPQSDPSERVALHSPK